MKKQLILLGAVFCLSFGTANGMQNTGNWMETDFRSMLMMRYPADKIIAYLRANQCANDSHLFDIISSNYISSEAKLNALQVIMQELKRNTSDVKRIKEKTLIYAAQFGEINLVEFLFKQGTCIDTRDNEGNTALHYAMRGFDKDRVIPVRRWVVVPELVEFLIDKGANLNAKNKNGETPLDMLLYSLNNRYLSTDVCETRKEDDANMFELLSFLKEHEIDPTSIKQQIFAGALKNEWRTTLKFVLNIGVNINDPVDENGTALHFAVRKCQVKLVKLLLKNKADPTIQDQNRHTPAEIAQQKIDGHPLRWDRSMYEDILKILTSAPNSL